MLKIKKYFNFIVIIAIIAYSLLSLCNRYSYAANQFISENVEELNETEYPGIKEMINKLKVQHPNWNFKIFYTNLDWNEVIANEYTGHEASPRNLISKNYQGAWICSICGDKAYDNGSWHCASEATIKYIMDPRNWLNSSEIFQFEELTYNGCDKNTIDVMINGTFMQGLADVIIQVGEDNNINPYYKVARLIQEQGKSGTVLTSGEKGFYNPFNIGASGNTSEQIIANGVAYAERQGWNTLEAGINGGIDFLSKEYIKKGQNTLYLQKFDVESVNSGLYWHQYMQNILAAQNEATTLRDTYIEIGAMESSHTFIIPVYKNMPQEKCASPDGSDSSTITSDIVKVNVDQSLRLRNEPNGTTTVGWLWKNVIVSRLEKAITKVNGTYWDKIRKADGTVGYAARETYESEGSYKLYLVPLIEEEEVPNDKEENSNVNNDNNKDEIVNDNNSISGVSTEKVKIDETQKIISVKSDVIAQDILDAFGGAVKIVKADGTYLENEKSVIGTGYVVRDEYTVIKSGDCNGDGKIDSMDMYQIIQYILENIELDKNNLNAADINQDTKIDSMDMYLIINEIINN